MTRDLSQVVVTVEHASPRVPRGVDLGLPKRVLDSHFSWDPGAAIVGRMLAKEFDAPLHLSRYSRLLVDLNRSSFHPRVIARDLRPGNRVIPGNQLTRAQRRARVERFWRPWREAVDADLDRAVDVAGCAFHISVHSFVERLNGTERHHDFGLLYRPSSRVERALADRLHERLVVGGYSVRRNQPYSGLDDGHCMRLRAERPQRRYVGMEIEMNQRDVRDAAGARRFGRALIDAFAPEFAARVSH